MPSVKLESDTRENELIGFIGTNRTGKTAGERFFIEEWKRHNDGLVMGFDSQKKLQDLIDIPISATDKSYKQKILKLKNGLIVLDDVRVLHPKNIAEDWLMDLMSFRNDNNVDILYSVHNPSLVLNLLSFYTTKYYVFYTESTEGSWERKIPNYTRCLAASLYINRYVSVMGRGTYPNFPHIIVDNEKRTLTGVNIKKRI